MGSVNAWKQSGAVHLWRYEDASRSYAGWHVAFDRAGLNAIT
jgi:hypothetical protein